MPWTVGINSEGGTGAIANPATTDVIAHGLGFAPDAQDIHIVFTTNWGAADAFFISCITACNFTVNLDAAPGACVTVNFAWKVITND